MMRLMAFLLLCVAVSPAWAAPALVGNWFGQGQPDDKTSMYLDHFLPNGQIRSQFRTCVKGHGFDSHEDGVWSVAGNILTIKVAHHDGVAAPRTDTYRLTLVTSDRFKDFYLPLNFPFDEHRVDDKFEMPACQLTS